MAHDVKDYYIGKGIVSFTPSGGSKRDLGNVPEFELTPELETLDHYSSREGVRTKDKSVVLTKAMTVRIVMDNWSVENLQMVLLGSTPSGGAFDIFDTNAITGELEFAGANEIGPTVLITLFNVSFAPGSSINLLSDEWGQIELTGEALVATTGVGTGKIGTVEWTASTEA
jgi:hypothetical protein